MESEQKPESSATRMVGNEGQDAAAAARASSYENCRAAHHHARCVAGSEKLACSIAVSKGQDRSVPITSDPQLIVVEKPHG